MQAQGSRRRYHLLALSPTHGMVAMERGSTSGSSPAACWPSLSQGPQGGPLEAEAFRACCQTYFQVCAVRRCWNSGAYCWINTGLATKVLSRVCEENGLFTSPVMMCIREDHAMQC